MTTIVPQCFTCRRYKGIIARGTHTCDAFENGIPREILYNDFDHRDPHPWDGGLRYEPLPEMTHPHTWVDDEEPDQEDLING